MNPASRNAARLVSSFVRLSAWTNSGFTCWFTPGEPSSSICNVCRPLPREPRPPPPRPLVTSVGGALGSSWMATSENESIHPAYTVIPEPSIMRASGGVATSVPTASIKPSRSTTVAVSTLLPGEVMTVALVIAYAACRCVASAGWPTETIITINMAARFATLFRGRFMRIQ